MACFKGETPLKSIYLVWQVSLSEIEVDISQMKSYGGITAAFCLSFSSTYCTMHELRELCSVQ
jgi:hypothetical protein